jgi:hypothetical protein
MFMVVKQKYGITRGEHLCENWNIWEDSMKLEFMKAVLASIRSILDSHDLYSSKVGFVVIRILR